MAPYVEPAINDGVPGKDAASTFPQYGDVESNGLKKYQINKEANVLVENGKCLATVDDVTPSYYKIANASSKKPFAMAKGRRFRPTDGYFPNDAGTYKAALATDETVGGVFEGPVILKVGEGTVRPGHYVMPDANGDYKEWDESDPDQKAALCLGKPGQNMSEWKSTIAEVGDLIRCEWVGGL